MSGFDKVAARVAALAVLLLVSAAALRGYLPAGGNRSDRQTGGNPAAMFLLDALVTVALGIVAFAIIARMRERRAAATRFGALAASPDNPLSRPSRRLVLTAVGVICGGLLLTMLLVYLLARYHIGELSIPAPVPGDSGSAPAPPPGGLPHRSQQPGQPASGALFDYFLTTLAALVTLVVIGAVVTRDRRRVAVPTDSGGGRPTPVPAATGPESLARAATLGLVEIADPGHEPRAAIIRCYAAMERELADVPGAAPQDCDTPTEVLSRAVAQRVLAPGNARQLVSLFTEARFSPHLMTERHRQAAIGVLRLVLEELRGVK